MPCSVHGRLGGEDAAERADAEHGMRVGVAGGPGVESLARRLVGHGLLRVAGNGVVFGVGSDDRAVAVGPGGDEGGRHLAAAFFDVEAFVAQQVDIGLGGFVFAPGRFGVAPDLEIEVGEPLSVCRRSSRSPTASPDRSFRLPSAAISFVERCMAPMRDGGDSGMRQRTGSVRCDRVVGQVVIGCADPCASCTTRHDQWTERRWVADRAS